MELDNVHSNKERVLHSFAHTYYVTRIHQLKNSNIRIHRKIIVRLRKKAHNYSHVQFNKLLKHSTGVHLI